VLAIDKTLSISYAANQFGSKDILIARPTAG
jgi:hypothetical protein